MQLIDVIKTFPNGLHDSELKHYRHDLSKNSIILDLSIWVGDLYSTDIEIRERYEDYEIEIGGIGYWALGFIENGNLNGEYGSEIIDVGLVNEGNIEKFTIPSEIIQSKRNIYWMYIGSINQNLIFTCNWGRIINKKSAQQGDAPETGSSE